MMNMKRLMLLLAMLGYNDAATAIDCNTLAGSNVFDGNFNALKSTFSCATIGDACLDGLIALSSTDKPIAFTTISTQCDLSTTSTSSGKLKTFLGSDVSLFNALQNNHSGRSCKNLSDLSGLSASLLNVTSADCIAALASANSNAGGFVNVRSSALNELSANALNAITPSMTSLSDTEFALSMPTICVKMATVANLPPNPLRKVTQACIIATTNKLKDLTSAQITNIFTAMAAPSPPGPKFNKVLIESISDTIVNPEIVPAIKNLINSSGDICDKIVSAAEFGKYVDQIGELCFKKLTDPFKGVTQNDLENLQSVVQFVTVNQWTSFDAALCASVDHAKFSEKIEMKDVNSTVLGTASFLKCYEKLKNTNAALVSADQLKAIFSNTAILSVDVGAFSKTALLKVMSDSPNNCTKISALHEMKTDQRKELTADCFEEFKSTSAKYTGLTAAEFAELNPLIFAKIDAAVGKVIGDALSKSVFKQITALQIEKLPQISSTGPARSTDYAAHLCNYLLTTLSVTSADLDRFTALNDFCTNQKADPVTVKKGSDLTGVECELNKFTLLNSVGEIQNTLNCEHIKDACLAQIATNLSTSGYPKALSEIRTKCRGKLSGLTNSGHIMKLVGENESDFKEFLGSDWVNCKILTTISGYINPAVYKYIPKECIAFMNNNPFKNMTLASAFASIGSDSAISATSLNFLTRPQIASLILSPAESQNLAKTVGFCERVKNTSVLDWGIDFLKSADWNNCLSKFTNVFTGFTKSDYESLHKSVWQQIPLGKVPTDTDAEFVLAFPAVCVKFDGFTVIPQSFMSKVDINCLKAQKTANQLDSITDVQLLDVQEEIIRKLTKAYFVGMNAAIKAIIANPANAKKFCTNFTDELLLDSFQSESNFSENCKAHMVTKAPSDLIANDCKLGDPKRFLLDVDGDMINKNNCNKITDVCLTEIRSSAKSAAAFTSIRTNCKDELVATKISLKENIDALIGGSAGMTDFIGPYAMNCKLITKIKDLNDGGVYAAITDKCLVSIKDDAFEGMTTAAEINAVGGPNTFKLARPEQLQKITLATDEYSNLAAIPNFCSRILNLKRWPEDFLKVVDWTACLSLVENVFDDFDQADFEKLKLDVWTQIPVLKVPLTTEFVKAFTNVCFKLTDFSKIPDKLMETIDYDCIIDKRSKSMLNTVTQSQLQILVDKNPTAVSKLTKDDIDAMTAVVEVIFANTTTANSFCSKFLSDEIFQSFVNNADYIANCLPKIANGVATISDDQGVIANAEILKTINATNCTKLVKALFTTIGQAICKIVLVKQLSEEYQKLINKNCLEKMVAVDSDTVKHFEAGALTSLIKSGVINKSIFSKLDAVKLGVAVEGDSNLCSSFDKVADLPSRSTTIELACINKIPVVSRYLLLTPALFSLLDENLFSSFDKESAKKIPEAAWAGLTVAQVAKLKERSSNEAYEDHICKLIMQDSYLNSFKSDVKDQVQSFCAKQNSAAFVLLTPFTLVSASAILYLML